MRLKITSSWLLDMHFAMQRFSKARHTRYVDFFIASNFFHFSLKNASDCYVMTSQCIHLTLFGNHAN